MAKRIVISLMYKAKHSPKNITKCQSEQKSKDMCLVEYSIRNILEKKISATPTADSLKTLEEIEQKALSLPHTSH